MGGLSKLVLPCSCLAVIWGPQTLLPHSLFLSLCLSLSVRSPASPHLSRAVCWAPCDKPLRPITQVYCNYLNSRLSESHPSLSLSMKFTLFRVFPFLQVLVFGFSCSSSKWNASRFSDHVHMLSVPHSFSSSRVHVVAHEKLRGCRWKAAQISLYWNWTTCMGMTRIQ